MPALACICKALDQSRELIAEWQKLRHIGDRSELGWSAVAEYTTEELADNFEDEKRLKKAERSAVRKAAKQKTKHVEPAAIKWVHSLCQIQPLKAQLCQACRQVTRSQGTQECHLPSYLGLQGHALPAEKWGICGLIV